MTSALEPQHAVEELLAIPPIDSEGFTSIIESAVDRENRAREYYEPPPIPIWLWQLGTSAELSERATLLDRFDGLKLGLGMTPGEVIGVFGEPNVKSGPEQWIYSVQPKRSYRQIIVSIEFDNERVKAIYTQQYGRPRAAHTASGGT